MKQWLRLCLLIAVVLAVPVQGQNLTEDIRLNQIGFYPEAPKAAVVLEAAPGPFYLLTPSHSDTLFAGTLGEALDDERTSETTRIADFSVFQRPGTYVVAVPGTGVSYPFEIKPHVHDGVTRAAMKGFYYQRASTALPAAYAGPWSRPAGHPDTQVLVHSSAASPERPAGMVLSAPRGWYDAGDYNKYIVNSGITVATLLSLYEDFPAYLDTLGLSIPESNNTVPDVLDEVLWNLRWMSTMQDPNDGGVYHKLTTADFEGMVMPDAARAQRYVVQKSTAATLDFAAVMAQASRVFRTFDEALPGLSDSTLAAALTAWRWAQRHPDTIYNQNALNEAHDPDINTGAYGGRDVSDEWAWAASELYVTTRADSFYMAIPQSDNTPLPSWGQVRTLGLYTLARFRNALTPAASADLPEIERLLITAADVLVEGASQHVYRTPMGASLRDYVWGSSAVAANQGIALIQAYRLTHNPTYLDYALANLDYLLGRNGTGYSFVTGYGDKTPMHPHHRPSEADGVAEPVPGLLAGGPNPGQQDGCTYPTQIVNQSYVDHVCSYASNEIAINWNAPLAYLAGALEALHAERAISP